MAIIADVASHYAEAAREHKAAQARALRKARLFERQSAIAQDLRRDATAELMAERAHEQHVDANRHLEAADLLTHAARWEARP